MKILEGNSIQLRAPEPEDLDILYKWENDTDIWDVSNTLTPFSKYILKKYIETAHLDIYETKQLRFMIDSKDLPGQTVGTIDLFDFDPQHWRAGVGILIGTAESRGKGLAKDALVTLINYSFTVLKLHQLFCHIVPSNEASVNLFTKCGFEIIGERKEWIRTPEGWMNEYILQLINPLQCR